MKPVFGITTSQNKKNTATNAAGFITKTAPKSLTDSLQAKRRHLCQIEAAGKLSPGLNIVMYFCDLLGWSTIVAVLFLISSMGFVSTFQSHPITVIGGLLCCLVGMILHCFSRKKSKNSHHKKAVEQQRHVISHELAKAYAALGVPKGAPSVDIFVFRYKEKKGECRLHTPTLPTASYKNESFKLFVSANKLHLANTDHVYSFDKTDLYTIKAVNKRVMIPTWNKTIPPEMHPLFPENLTVTRNRIVYAKPYYILQGIRDGEIFGIYFPCYELEIFESLTRLRAER